MAKPKTAETKTETAFPDERAVRLKPYNPRAGLKLQRYTYRGIKMVGVQWYRLPLSVATYLKSVRNDFDDPHSPKAFDVYTIEEAEQIQKNEYEHKVSGGLAKPGDTPIMVPRETDDQIRPGVDPKPIKTTDLTTADLRRKEQEPPAQRTSRPA